ncbi:MAG: hypothetical protein JSU03_00840 [Bacteroidetes bacterium]|nr:hypothetical protein [Bacteroidota bacterium]
MKLLIDNINRQFDISIAADANTDKLQQALAEQINYLIIHDFNRLIQILYRIDVNEKKLKTLLKENAQYDAANIIAAQVIERQLQKIKTRQQYGRDENNINEEERW